MFSNYHVSCILIYRNQYEMNNINNIFSLNDVVLCTQTRRYFEFSTKTDFKISK